MEIKKADSKGRVSGFPPSENYEVHKLDQGRVMLVPIKRADLSFLDESTDWYKDVAWEQIDRFPEQARKTGGISAPTEYVPAPYPPAPVKNSGIGISKGTA